MQQCLCSRSQILREALARCGKTLWPFVSQLLARSFIIVSLLCSSSNHPYRAECFILCFSILKLTGIERHVVDYCSGGDCVVLTHRHPAFALSKVPHLSAPREPPLRTNHLRALWNPIGCLIPFSIHFSRKSDFAGWTCDQRGV